MWSSLKSLYLKLVPLCRNSYSYDQHTLPLVLAGLASVAAAAMTTALRMLRNGCKLRGCTWQGRWAFAVAGLKDCCCNIILSISCSKELRA